MFALKKASTLKLAMPLVMAIAAFVAFVSPAGELYDVVVVGGGPAGIGAALAAAKAGAKTALIERDSVAAV